MTIDKVEGIQLQGVYFGGVEESEENAESTAKDCVNTIKGGTIMPKIVQVGGPGQLLDAMFEAADSFEKLVEEMSEAESVIKRAQERKKK